MKKEKPKSSQHKFISLGFLLLILGVLLSTVIDAGWSVQVGGIVMLVIASGFFGMSWAESRRGKIEGQYLGTKEEIGYVITDIATVHQADIVKALKAIPGTIRVRVLY